MPGYAEADLIQARKPIKDQLARDEAYCVLGHLEVEQREAATSERAETVRAIQANIATFDGVEPEAEDDPTDPTLTPQPTAGGSTPAPVPSPTPPAPSPAPVATDIRALGEASMRRTLARAGITPVGSQQTPAGASDGVSASMASMQRTLARMGLQPKQGG